MKQHYPILLSTALIRLLTLFFLFRHGLCQTGEELAAIYQDTFTLFEVFPPIDGDPGIWKDDSVEPIDVVLSTNILSIDEINPGASRFTATIRTTTYWKKSACEQTETHKAACDSTVNQLRFVSGDNVAGTPSVSLRLNVEDIHDAVFTEQNQTDIQPDAELVESQQTLVQVCTVQKICRKGSFEILTCDSNRPLICVTIHMKFMDWSYPQRASTQPTWYV